MLFCDLLFLSYTTAIRYVNVEKNTGKQRLYISTDSFIFGANETFAKSQHE